MPTIYTNRADVNQEHFAWCEIRSIDDFVEEPAVTISFTGKAKRGYSQLDDDHLLTTDEVAEWLQVKSNTLAKARYDGMSHFPDHKKIGGRGVRYRVGDVRSWLKERHREHGGYLL